MRLQRCSREWLASGFTLIELLVVVFLIGLVSGFAVLSIHSRGDNREIFEELQRFRHRLTLAGSEAVIQGRPIGVQLDEKRYQFLLAGQTEWQELNDIEALQPQELPPEWKIEPLLGSREVSFQKVDVKSNGQQDDKIEAKLIPHIIYGWKVNLCVVQGNMDLLCLR